MAADSRQGAAGSVEKGVRSQNSESRRQKHKECSFILAPDSWLLEPLRFERLKRF
jgi:hypothetical protein